MTDTAEETIDLSDGGTRDSFFPQSSERADKPLKKKKSENVVTFNQFEYPDWPTAFQAADGRISTGSAPGWNETNIVLLNTDTKEFRQVKHAVDKSTTCCGQGLAVANSSHF
jgi:hypothetical protein